MLVVFGGSGMLERWELLAYWVSCSWCSRCIGRRCGHAPTNGKPKHVRYGAHHPHHSPPPALQRVVVSARVHAAACGGACRSPPLLNTHLTPPSLSCSELCSQRVHEAVLVVGHSAVRVPGIALEVCREDGQVDTSFAAPLKVSASQP